MSSVAQVALFKDINPWETTGNEDALNDLGLSYDVFPSTEMGSVNLSQYQRVVLASDQPQAFYDRLVTHLSRFESYTAAGGALQLNACDQGWVDGLWSAMPGGISHVNGYSQNSVQAVDPTHPIFNIPHTISDGNLDNWNYSSHGYFTDLPPGTRVLVENEWGPVLIEFNFGTGFIIASMQTLEWAYSKPGCPNPSLFLANVITYHGQAGTVQDSDGDGLPDYLETNGWRNARGFFRTDPHRADTDGDGLEDGIEKRGNTHPKRTDTDRDGLSDGEEDVNHDGIVDRYESDPNRRDSDGDRIKDGDDPVRVKPGDRKALVIWLTEFQKHGKPLQGPKTTAKPDRSFEILGFEVTSHIDKRGDKKYFTYDQITQWISDFANGLDDNDVAIVFISTHGGHTGNDYRILYGDGLYSESRVSNQLKQVGPALDFLWLETCESWYFEDELDQLSAEGIIFYGAKGLSMSHIPVYGFYKAIAGATAFPEITGIVPLFWTDYYDSSKAQCNVEDVIDDVNAVNASKYRVWEMRDNRAGKMDLLDLHLTRASSNRLARVSQLEGLLTVTPTLSLTGVSYFSYDSNTDGLDDALEIGWVADTALSQEEAIAEVQVYNKAGDLEQLYLVGPYTVTSGAFQTVTVDFLSTVSTTHEAAIELYSLPYVLAGVARSDEIALRAGPGSADGDEGFVSTTVSQGDVLTVSFSISTTAVTETVAVVGMLATDRQTLASVTATVRSPDYLVTGTAPVTGSLTFTPPVTGVYYINLYLVDQNDYVEDIAQIHPWSTGVYTESVVDTNENGLYDQLVIDIGLLPPQAGDYILRGQLYDTDGNHIADAITFGYLPEMGASLPITFAGTAIRRSRLDGPYELRELTFRSANDGAIDFLQVAYETDAYSFADFEVESALLSESYRDYLVDSGGDGYAETLGIDVGLTCAVPSTYTLEASLYDANGAETGYIVTSTLLATGQSTTTLAFDGRLIRSNGVDGPYTLGDLMLRDFEGETTDHRDSAYQTAAYSATQFLPPGAVLAGSYADYGLDTDGDGLYNYLAIDVALDVAQAGIYQLDGMITGTIPYHLPWTSNRLSLPAGVQTVTLNFNGKAIRDSQVGGWFSLAHVSIFEGSSGLLVDSGHNLYTTTHIYSHTQFQRDPLVVTGVITDAGLDTDADGLYDWLNVALSLDGMVSETYEIQARLTSTGNLSISDLSQQASLVTGTNRLVVSFDGTHIEYAGIHGPYRIQDFYVYSLDQPALSLLVREFYTTTTVYSATQFAPDLTPPSSTVKAMAPITNMLELAVSWGGTDSRPGLGVESYDIQYMDTVSPGVWIDWLTHTQSLTARFGPDTPMVEDYHTYCFRSRARDRAGNEESYPAGNGDTCVTAETERDLDIGKYIHSGTLFAGSDLQYRIDFHNHGTGRAREVVITDVLPISTTFVSESNNVGATAVVNNGVVTWQGMTFQPNSSGYAYLTVYVDDAAPGGAILTNTVSIANSLTETTYTNNVYTHTATVIPRTRDLFVSKARNTGTAVAGAEIKYRIYFANQGNTEAADVIITDTLPFSTTYVSDYDSYGFTTVVTGSTVVWTKDTVAAGSSGYIYLTMRVNDDVAGGTLLTNTVSVSTGDGETDYSDNVYTYTLIAETPTRNVYIDKSLTDGNATPGNDVTYRLYYLNYGNAPAHGVLITDTLPSYLSYLSHSGDFTPSVSGNQVIWDLGTVPGSGYAGYNGYLYITAHISENVPVGTVLTNTAVITTTDSDADPGNNRDEYTVTVIEGQPNLYLSKSLKNATLPQGSEVIYELYYRNYNISAAVPVVVTDDLPSGLSFVSATGAPTPTVNGQAVVWRWPSLPGYATGYIYLTAYVSDTLPVGTTVTNTAVITASNDTNPANNADDDVRTVTTASRDLYVDKTLDSGTPLPGNDLTYRIYYRNYGNAHLPDVIITDTLPAGTTFVSASGDFMPTVAGNTVVWQLGSVPGYSAPGYFGYLYITVHISDDVPAATVLRNRVEGTTSALETGTYSNWDEHASTVQARTRDLRVYKTYYSGTPVGGNDITYRMQVYNDGNSSAANVRVTDTLPVSATYASWSGDSRLALSSITDGQVVWTANELPGSFSSSYIYLTVHLEEGLPSDVELSNRLEASTDDVETDYSNNVVIHTLRSIGEGRDLKLTKSWISGSPLPGNALTYRLDYANLGTLSASNIVVTDTLPISTTFHSTYASGWSYMVSGRKVTWTRSSLNGQYSGYINLTLYVSGTVPAGTILTNTAVIRSGDVDLNPTNNAAAYVIPVASGSRDLYIDKTLSGGNAVPGGEITYRLYYRNYGTDAASRVVVTDTLPEGVNYVSASGDFTPTLVGNQVVWQLGTVPGQYTSGYYGYLYLTVRVGETVPVGKWLNNTAEISTADQETGFYSNLDTYGLTVQPATRDVRVDKSLSSGNATPGNNLTYRIYYRNDGNSPVSGVVVTDTLPVSTTYLSFSGSYTPTLSGNRLVWNLGTVPAYGYSGYYGYLYTTLHLSEQVPIGTVLVNTAQVAASSPETDYGNNSDLDAQTVFTGTSDLRLYKYFESGQARQGSEVIYRLYHYNYSYDAATNVTLTDTLPVSTTYVSSTGGPEPAIDGNRVVWHLPSIPGKYQPGYAGNIYLTVHISNDVPVGTVLTNTAAITAPNDTYPANNSDIDVRSAVGAPDITVSPTVLTATLGPGGTTIRTLAIGNEGNTSLGWSLAEYPGVAWLNESPSSGAVVPSDRADVAVSFDSTGVTAGVYTTTLWIISDDPDESQVDVVVTMTVRAPEPTWEKLVYVNGVLINTSPIFVTVSDSVEIIDQVRITSAANVSYTLVETWTESLGLVDWATDIGSVITTVNTLEWGVTDAVPDTWYIITKSLAVLGDEWVYGYVIETLRVEGADPQLGDRVLIFAQAGMCLPVNIMSLESDSPVALDETMHFTSTVLGDPPISYAWDFGGAGTQGGTDTNPIFQYDAAGTYTVTLGAENGCPSHDSASIVVMVQAPDIVVYPEMLEVELASGETTSRTLVIGNEGDADLVWSLAEDPETGWLGKVPSGGTVVPSGDADVEVGFDATEMAGGVYTTTLHISSNDPDEPQVDVLVRMAVKSPVLPQEKSVYLPVVMKNH